MDLWFKHLTVPKLIYSILRKAFMPETEVYYPKISSPANALLKIFKTKGLLKWVVFKELLFGVHAKKGESLGYRVEELTNIAVEEAFNKFFSEEEFMPFYLREFASRIHIAFKSYLIKLRYRPKIRFLCAIDHLYRTDPLFKNKTPEYRLGYIPLFSAFNKAISPHVRGKLHLWPSPLDIIKESLPLKIFASLFGLAAERGVFLRKCRSKYSKLSQDTRSKILVEFNRRAFIDFEHTHLFWFSKSGIIADRVIMGFDRPDAPRSEENMRLVEQYGMRWLDLKTTAMLFHASNPIKALLQSFMRTPFPRRLTAPFIWRWKTMLELTYFLEIWRDIFRKYRIKVLHQHQEHDFWSQIQALAVNMEGGIYFWFHWSLDRYPSAHFNAGYCDIYFSWGKLHRDYIDMHKLAYRYMIDVGFIWDSAYGSRKKRLDLDMNKKVDFIVTIFGTSYGPSNECSPYNEGYLHESMLRMVLAHPTWAAIVKPKNEGSIDKLPNRDKVKALLEKLAGEKRGILLSALHSPFTLAGITDVCVCQSINSAGSIAALSGARAIYWDLIGSARHPYYLNMERQLVFKTRDEVASALESLAQNRQKSRIGDHSSWLDMLDPYRDGEASLRSGGFINSFLSYTDEGDTRDAALQKAVKKFEEMWGRERVYSFETKNERLDDNIWIRAERDLRK